MTEFYHFYERIENVPSKPTSLQRASQIAMMDEGLRLRIKTYELWGMREDRDE
jgi:hypothetical protein